MKPKNGDVVIIDKNATTKWQNSRCVVTVVNKATETALVKILKDSKGKYVYHEENEIWVTFTALKVVFTHINLMELIDMALDMRDEEWFLELTEFKKYYDKAIFGGALSGKE
jgi:uncharacterized protein YpiB (UPF0302 family)